MKTVYILIPVEAYNKLNEEDSNYLFNVCINKNLDKRSYEKKDYYLFEASTDRALQSIIKNYKFYSKDEIIKMLGL